MGVEVSKFEVLGRGNQDTNDLLSRRQALGGLSFGLMGLTVPGMTLDNVGIQGRDATGNVGTLSGFISSNKLIIVPGGCVSSHETQRNPILYPGYFHAAPLSNLNPALLDQRALWDNFIKGKTKTDFNSADVAEFLSRARVYQVLVRDTDAHNKPGYRRYDLSQQSFNPPSIAIGGTGLVEIWSQGQCVVGPNDKMYLRMLYGVDKNRINPESFIAVCESGQPPRENGIICAELQTPIVPGESDASWWIRDGVQRESTSPTNFASEPGSVALKGGDFMWRHTWTPEGNYVAECRRHGDRDAGAWNEMGADLFFKLVQNGSDVVIVPEPGALDDSRLVLSSDKLCREIAGKRCTGLILYSGGPEAERTSLTKLRNSGHSVSIEGDRIIVQRKGGTEDTYTMVRIGTKPGFHADTVEVYAVKTATMPQGFQLPAQIGNGSVGSFDMIAGYKRGARLTSRDT